MKMGKGIFQVEVTTRESALSGFHGDVRDRPIPRNHSQIVKYSGRDDPDFFKFVGSEIRALVCSSIWNMNASLQALHMKLQHISPLGKHKPSKSTGPVIVATVAVGSQKKSRWMTKVTLDEMIYREKADQQSNINGAIADEIDSEPWQFEWDHQDVFEDVLDALMSGVEDEDLQQVLSNQLTDVRGPIEGTCEWLLDEKLYHGWENASHSKILFINGIEGLGKSVLAKYVVQRLHHEFPSAVVAFSFCKGIQDHERATTILRHVILQIESQDQGAIRDAVKTRNFESFVRRSDFDILWSLFQSMMQSKKKRLFCIIDGIDEIIGTRRFIGSHQASGHRVDAEEVQAASFLSRLCEYLQPIKTTDPMQERKSLMNQSTAVLFTSRPLEQVLDAVGAKNNDVVITIEAEKVKERARKMIEEDIRVLVTDLDLSGELEGIIRSVLFSNTDQAGSSFQWAYTALQKLRSYKSQSGQFMKDRLAEFLPDVYSLYRNSLNQILEDSHLTILASTLFSLLKVSQEELPIEAVCDIFELGCTGELLTEVDRAILNSAIESCRGLIRINSRQVLEFNHDTVRTFLQELSPSDYPVFSYADKRVDHYLMTSVCLDYLLRWNARVLSEGKVTNLRHIAEFAQFVKPSFLLYAWNHWHFHAFASGELIMRLMGPLQSFLKPVDSAYQSIQRLVNTVSRVSASSGEESAILPAHLLAAWDLMHVLKAMRLKPLSKGKGLLKRMFNKKEMAGFHFCLDLSERDSLGRSILHIAAMEGSLQTTAYLLEFGSTGNVFDVNGDTRFSLALSSDQPEAARLLMHRHQAFERTYEPQFLSSLHLACARNMEDTVAYLLAKGAQVNQMVLEANWTPLQAAVEAGNMQIVEMLVTHGAQLDTVQKNGRTALHIAAIHGHLAITELLFSARPGLDPAPRNRKGETPIANAAQFGKVDVFSFLQKKKAYVEPDENGWLPIHCAAYNGHRLIIDLIPYAQNLETETRFKYRPIHLAVRGGHLEIVKDLVIRGAFLDIAATDTRSPHNKPSITMTPLCLAMITRNLEIVKYLLTQKVDVFGWRGFTNRSYLHNAASYFEDVHILRSLVEDYKLDVFLKDDCGVTPLHLAAQYGSLEGLQYLWSENVEQKMDIDDRDGNGLSMLGRAIHGSRYKSAEYLLNQSANSNTVDFNGYSPIFHACELKDTRLLQLLIRWRAEINTRAIISDTPLGKAARRGNIPAVEVLVKHGAEVDIQDNMGVSPLQEAASRSHQSCFERLLHLNADPFRLNGLGICALDYAMHSVSMRESVMVKDLLKIYEPISANARKIILKNTIVKHLQGFSLLQTRHIHGALLKTWVLWLGWLLWPLEMYAEAIVCFEHLANKTVDGSFSFPFRCEKCLKRKGPYWRCRQCLVMMICEDCYKKWDGGDIVASCEASYDYLEIGSAKWQALEHGIVDESGLTFEKWLEVMFKLFEVNSEGVVFEGV